jgi:hypothetical protein
VRSWQFAASGVPTRDAVEQGSKGRARGLLEVALDEHFGNDRVRVFAYFKPVPFGQNGQSGFYGWLLSVNDQYVQLLQTN